VAPSTIGISAYDMDAVDLVDLARAADEAGFDAVWLGEHVVLPVEYSTPHPTKKEAGVQHHTGPIVAMETELLDPFVELGAAAGATEHICLATGMFILPLRHPLATARAACTLQEVSGGRFLFGIGAGWLQEEFDALHVPFSERYGRFQESIELMRTAWAGGPFEHEGKYFPVRGVQVTSRPTHVPLIFGGNTDKALQRAARFGEGWFSSGTPLFDDSRRLRDTLYSLRDQYGRTGDCRCYVRVEGCDPAVVEEYSAEGFDDVVIWADQVWPAQAALDDKREALAKAATALGLTPRSHD